MSTRAAATELTRERIIDAAAALFNDQWYDDVTLREVAAAAGVALQTLVNHFASKETLFLAVTERNAKMIEKARWGVKSGDVTGAITALVDDYERNGDAIIRILAVEDRIPAVRPSIDMGREGHQLWVEDMFPAALEGLRGQTRKRRLAQLVVATDVYTWKLLRRDKGFDRKATITAMRELVLALHDRKGGRQ